MSGRARSVLLGVIGGYQRFISPVTPASCRFHPTCSEYARQSIDRHGALKGLGFAIRRLLRCHPFGGHGYDPVPPAHSDPQNEGRSIPAGKEAV